MKMKKGNWKRYENVRKDIGYMISCLAVVPIVEQPFATEANLKRHRKNNKLCKEYRENKRAILEATAKIIDPARDAKEWVDEVIRSE